MKWVLVFLLGVAGQLSFGKTVWVELIDDLGQPIVGADVSVWFWSPQRSFSDEKKFKSDASGQVTANGETIIGYAITADKPGYYGAKSETVLPPEDNLFKRYTLRRILGPTELHVNRFNIGSGHPGLHVPVQGEWLGYDFEVGDWMAPYGKGKVTDIQFRFKNEYKGYKVENESLVRAREISQTIARRSGKPWSEDEFKLTAGKWDAVLEISFPGEGEGMLEEQTRFLPYSPLKLPHLAPESGYEPTWRYEASTYKRHSHRPDVGFFLRTRVRRDRDGNIVSANYAKIYGDIFLAPTGSLAFWYYFNPKPNDRNLEFDPKKNLFPADFPGAKAHDP